MPDGPEKRLARAEWMMESAHLSEAWMALSDLSPSKIPRDLHSRFLRLRGLMQVQAGRPALGEPVLREALAASRDVDEQALAWQARLAAALALDRPAKRRTRQ